MANSTCQRPLHPTRDYGIVLLGMTGSGKSSTGNTILGRKVFEAEASGESVTDVTTYATSVYGDRKITVVDTLGVHDNVRSVSDVKQENTRMAFMLREGVHCFVICMDASNVRVTTETRQFLDAVKVSGHADFYDYCMLVYTKPESELYHISLDQYIEKQKEHVDMKSFLEKLGDRVLVVNNRADATELTGYKDAIISMVEKVITDNVIKMKPKAFTNDTLKKANEIRKKVVTLVNRANCHPSLVNAVIEAVISLSSKATFEENQFVEKVLHILSNSPQCKNDGGKLVFKNDNVFTTMSVVTCEKHIKMIYKAVQPEISLFYTVLAKVLKYKAEIALGALAGVAAGAGTAIVVSLVGIESVGAILGLPAVIGYALGGSAP